MNSRYEAPTRVGQASARALVRLGFVEVARKGSHLKMKHEAGRLIVFPYNDEIDRFTLKGALSDAEIDPQEFVDALR